MDNSKEGLDRGKVSIIYIYRILKEYSDYDHLLTQQDIINKLEWDYNIAMERKAVKRNLSVLEEAGIEIEYMKKGCYLASQEFLDSELRLLIDGVLCSKHITAKQSKSLINRLIKQSNKYFKPHIKHVFSVEDWDKTDNQALFLNIELIDEAIEGKKQIHYDYNKYGTDKKLHKSSQQYVSPYQLILHNQRYYLMAYSEYWGNMVYHRLDHITNMTITDKKAFPLRELRGYENGIDYNRLAAQMPYMYADEPVTVDFVADTEIIDQIVDWFGKNIKITPISATNDRVLVTVKASPQAMKHWAMQYAEFIEIVSPITIREEVMTILNSAYERYR